MLKELLSEFERVFGVGVVELDGGQNKAVFSENKVYFTIAEASTMSGFLTASGSLYVAIGDNYSEPRVFKTLVKQGFKGSFKTSRIERGLEITEYAVNLPLLASPKGSSEPIEEIEINDAIVEK